MTAKPAIANLGNGGLLGNNHVVFGVVDHV